MQFCKHIVDQNVSLHKTQM